MGAKRKVKPLQADEALRKSEERYRLLFERNLAGVMRTTLEGQILDVNDSMLRILGYDSLPGHLAHPASDFYMNRADRPGLMARLQDNPVLTNFELQMRRKDGTPIWTLANISRIDGPTAKLSWRGTVVDIDQQKQ